MDMRPTLIEMEGFGSYLTATEVDLSGVDLAAIVGSNGAGKSTLLDSVLFALYGETRADADSVVSTDADTARVVLWFDAADGTRWRVTRTRTAGKRGRTGLVLEHEDDDREWVSSTGHTLAATQAEINRVVGGSIDMMAATVFASQGDINRFSESDPAARKQILAELLGLDRFDRLASGAKEAANAAAAQVGTLTGRIDDLDERLSTLDGDQEALAAAITAAAEAEEAVAAAEEAEGKAAQVLGESRTSAAAVDDLDARLVGLRRARSDAKVAAERELDRLRAALGRAEQAKAAAEAGLEAVGKAEAQMAALDAEITAARERLDDAKERLDTLVEEGQAAAAAVTAAETAISAERSALAKANETRTALQRSVDEGGGHCWACQQSLTDDHVTVMLAALDAEIAATEGRIRGAEDRRRDAEGLRDAKKAEWRDTKQHVDDTQGALDGFTDQRTKAEATAGRRGEFESALATADEEISGLTAEIATAKSALGGFDRPTTEEVETEQRLNDARIAAAGVQGLVADHERAVSVLRTAREALSEAVTTKGRLVERVNALFEAKTQRKRLADDLDVATKEQATHALLAKAFGRDGIPALILEGVVPELSDEMNDVLNTLSNGALGVELSTSRESKSGKQIERLEIVVSDDQGQRPYSTFSGGERLRVDLALRVALARLMARRSGTPVRTLVLDEAWGALDEQGVAATVECLRALTAEFPLVLTVTHEPEVAAGFPTVVEVTKHADGSHVEIRA